MSELKYYPACITTPKGKFLFPNVYLKDEADKVLAEKDAEIAELKDKLQNVSELLKETREWLIESQKLHKRCADNAIKTIRHHKYKRCLAMAMWCKAEQDAAFLRYNWDTGRYADVDFYEKWHKRWLELAEYFKPNKSTAQ